jgi:hypothetical protein
MNSPRTASPLSAFGSKSYDYEVPEGITLAILADYGEANHPPDFEKNKPTGRRKKGGTLKFKCQIQTQPSQNVKNHRFINCLTHFFEQSQKGAPQHVQR